jgi:hypothetical protein
MSHSVTGHTAIYSNPNGFPFSEGKTLHMEVSHLCATFPALWYLTHSPCRLLQQLTHGDLANRVITVGSPGRAELIAKHFDADKPVKVFHSNRGFVTHSGYYEGVYCSIVAIGMVSG